MKYKPGNKDREPSFQFQRQDLDDVKDVWDRIHERYSDDGGLIEFEFETVVRK